MARVRFVVRRFLETDSIPSKVTVTAYNPNFGTDISMVSVAAKGTFFEKDTVDVCMGLRLRRFSEEVYSV